MGYFWVIFNFFGALISYFWGLGTIQDWGASFDFLEPQRAIFGVIFNFFWALMSYFWGKGRVQELFWGLLMQLSNFYFL